MDAFVENQLTIDVWVYSGLFRSTLRVCMLILMPVPHCFGYSSSVIAFEIMKCESSPFVSSLFLCGYSRPIAIPY